MQIIIRTKYIPPTNTIGAKIRATFGGKTKSIPYPYALSGEAVHKSAALAWVAHHLTRQGWDDPSRFQLKTHYSDKRGYSFEVNTKQN
jgi:hypothetical protein